MNSFIKEEYNQKSQILKRYHEKSKIIGNNTKLTWDEFENQREEFCNCCNILKEKLSLLTKEERNIIFYKVYADSNVLLPNDQTNDAFNYSINCTMMEQKLISEGIDYILIQIEKNKIFYNELKLQELKKELEDKRYKLLEGIK